MRSFSIHTKQRNYSMHVGSHLLPHLPSLIQGNQAFILVDDKLFSQAHILQESLTKTGWTCKIEPLVVQETTKSFTSLPPLYEAMLKANLTRDSVLFALGGGVIGDIGGFLAGTYFRGIRWVGLPSTLLAQVDSAIGGKTGINHLGKNAIGLIYQPSLVVADTSLLSLLPFREKVSGFGEMIKMGLLLDPALYDKLTQTWTRLFELDVSSLEEEIISCAQGKAFFIEKDEDEKNGIRELLNLGHTVGHALEAITNYQYFRHGEAVILGLQIELFLSNKLGFLLDETYQTLISFLKKIKVPSLPKPVSISQILQKMKLDKKNKNNAIRMVLLKEIGKPFVHEFSIEELAPLLEESFHKYQISF